MNLLKVNYKYCTTKGIPTQNMQIFHREITNKTFFPPLNVHGRGSFQESARPSPAAAVPTSVCSGARQTVWCQLWQPFAQGQVKGQGFETMSRPHGFKADKLWQT